MKYRKRLLVAEISVDAGVEAVLSDMDGVFALKEEQRILSKAFVYS